MSKYGPSPAERETTHLLIAVRVDTPADRRCWYAQLREIRELPEVGAG